MICPGNQPRYFVHDKYGLLRTDCAEPGYGRATDMAEVIHLAANRAAIRERTSK